MRRRAVHRSIERRLAVRGIGRLGIEVGIRGVFALGGIRHGGTIRIEGLRAVNGLDVVGITELCLILGLLAAAATATTTTTATATLALLALRPARVLRNVTLALRALGTGTHLRGDFRAG